MLEIKALTKMNEDWGEDETDFFVSYQVDIGLSAIRFSSDMFAFDVVSPKRLNQMIESNGNIFGHGLIILNDFKEKDIEDALIELLNACDGLSEDDAYRNLAKYLNWEMNTFVPEL